MKKDKSALKIEIIVENKRPNINIYKYYSPQTRTYVKQSDSEGLKVKGRAKTDRQVKPIKSRDCILTKI